jgi:hypothetical protein
MANGTLSTKFELLEGLADNSNKEITASDVQNIVKSNFQPVMIWAGVFNRMNTNYWHPRTLYYNEDFFEPRSTGTGLTDATQVWRFTSRGNLAPSTTYLNVQVTPTTYPGINSQFEQLYPTQPATFNLHTDATGAVNSFDVVSCGQGWWGPGGTKTGSTWQYPGQTGTISIPGSSQNPTVEFIGPLTVTPETALEYSNVSWFLSKNPNEPTDPIPGQGSSADHTFANTLVLSGYTRGKGEQRYNTAWRLGPNFASEENATGTFHNQLSAEGLESDGDDAPQYVSLWRMPF